MMCEAGYVCDSGARNTCGENELPNGARSTCVPCRTCRVGEGFMSACLAGNNTVCQLCEANAVSTGGEDQCAECPENTRPNDSKTACVPCKTCPVGEGHVSACVNEVDTICEPCGPNAISAGGTQTCVECKENTRPNDSKTACVPCLRCEVGRGVVSFCNVYGGDTVCSPCVAGQFSPGGDTVCEWCVAGQFCPMGAFAPRQCLKGNFCKSISTADRVVWGSSEEPCPLGTYCPTGTVSPLPCAGGATCTVPASPELVISNNGVLEKRESELLTNETAYEASGFLHYTISLSVKPSGSVNVTVTKEELGQADCVQNNDGLILNRTTYVFDSSNWNVSQKVEIDVRRKKSFQGTSMTRFKHKVSSEDPVWQSPFLRPMTISSTDDNECTNGAQKEDDFIEGKDGQVFTIRTCVCTKGHFIEAIDALYCNSVTSCVPCTEGMICTGKETLDRILLAPGNIGWV
jgi:hypothetical protein